MENTMPENIDNSGKEKEKNEHPSKNYFLPADIIEELYENNDIQMKKSLKSMKGHFSSNILPTFFDNKNQDSIEDFQNIDDVEGKEEEKIEMTKKKFKTKNLNSTKTILKYYVKEQQHQNEIENNNLSTSNMVNTSFQEKQSNKSQKISTFNMDLNRNNLITQNTQIKKGNSNNNIQYPNTKVIPKQPYYSDNFLCIPNTIPQKLNYPDGITDVNNGQIYLGQGSIQNPYISQINFQNQMKIQNNNGFKSINLSGNNLGNLNSGNIKNQINNMQNIYNRNYMEQIEKAPWVNVNQIKPKINSINYPMGLYNFYNVPGNNLLINPVMNNLTNTNNYNNQISQNNNIDVQQNLLNPMNNINLSVFQQQNFQYNVNQTKRPSLSSMVLTNKNPYYINSIGQNKSNTMNNINNNPFSQMELNIENIKLKNNHQKKGQKTKNELENDILDTQIDLLFAQVFKIPTEQFQILSLIQNVGIPQFLNIIKTHRGSKNLQKILSNNPPKEAEVDYITKIICDNFMEIICDYYGNYFLQKFFPYCSKENRLNLYKKIQPCFNSIANDICGNHSLQCLILLQNSEEEKKIIKESIENELETICYGPNSSHVVQKVIKAVKEDERQYINTYIVNNLIQLCKDQFGICVVKEFMYNTKKKYYKKIIIDSFEKNLDAISNDQYGNFGIQEAIRTFGHINCRKIINSLLQNLISLSIKKFSSNVIDFLLVYLFDNDFNKFIQALKLMFLNENNFKEMIGNKFSVYVLENTLSLLNDITEDKFKNSLLNDKREEEINGSESDSSSDEESSEKIDYESFLKIKKSIFQFIENNSAAKERKKILALIKINKHKFM